jgi:pimeloyl-ACP methyl ester carboxylesterase
MSAVRRPPIWIAAAGVVIILTGAVLVFVLGPTHRIGPITVPGASPSPSSPPVDLLPAGQRSTVPVLLVHGYAGAPSQMQPLAERLTRQGRQVVVVTLPDRGTVDIRRSALTILVAVRRLHAPKVDVIGYSLGGVAARQALLFHDGSIKVRHLVMLATPNHGVRLPDDSGRPEQQHCEPDNACGELAPNSPLLKDLNKSPYAKGSRDWLTIASETDKLVHPPSVVALDGARNLVLQDVCPGSTEDHGQMDDAPAVMGLVELFLDDRLPANPVCSEALAAGQG